MQVEPYEKHCFMIHCIKRLLQVNPWHASEAVFINGIIAGR